MFQVGDYKIVFKKRWHDKRRTISAELRKSKLVQSKRLTAKMPEGDGRYDTVCEIDVGGLPRCTGIAKLHPNDQVDRIVGKKVALRNALQKAFPPIDPRTCGPAFELMKLDAERKFHRKEIWSGFWHWVSQWPNSKVNIYTVNHERRCTM